MKEELENSVVKPSIGFAVKDESFSYLNPENEVFLDNVITDVRKYILDNPGVTYVGKSQEVKDKAYGTMIDLVKEGKLHLRDVKFNFFLNRSQFNFIHEVIVNKLEYTVDTVFVALELRDTMFAMSKATYKSDDELIAFQLTATEITYLYHLISPFKVKGLNKTTFTFASLLQRIGELSKIINYYDTSMKNITDEVMFWVSRMGFEDLGPEQPEVVDTVTEEGA